MAYTKQTWTNGVSKLNATRMQYIEDGLEAAAAVADGGIAKTLIDAKGDLIAGSAADTAVRVPVGSNDRLLVADSAQSPGMKWAQLTNAMVDNAAAIAYSKLNLTTSIVNGDIAAAAAIAVSKLAAGSDTQILKTVGSTPTWSAGGVDILDRVATDTDVTNTTTETTIYTFSVPGGTLSTNKRLCLELFGEYQYTAGNTLTLRFKYGATTLSTIAVTAANVNNSAKGWKLAVDLIADGATNAQFMVVKGNGGEAELASAQQGSLEHAEEFTANGYGSSAEDSTAAKTLAVTVQWSAAVGTLHWKIKHATLKVV